MFVIRSILLGIGLAMDATCVAMTNGLNYPKLKKKDIVLVAFMFGFFQALMPFIGYLLGVSFSEILTKYTPIIALILLSILGGKMLLDGIEKKGECEEKIEPLSIKLLLIQAFATSIDALSVGIIMVDYTLIQLIIALSLIGIITFITSFVGVLIGKKFGVLLNNKATILGGIILILIGLEIFISGMF